MRCLVSLGSNLGDRIATVQGALACLSRLAGVRLLAASSLYETAPQDVVDQPPFINAACLIESALEPHALLRALQGIEQDFHRERAIPKGPRTLDLDLIAVEGVAMSDPTLTLPHPRLGQRAFVLVPLMEIAPGFVVAGPGKSVSEIYHGACLEGQDVRRI